MKVYLGTDHAGFELKEKVKALLEKEGFKVEDLGAYEYDKNDDYPDFISKVGQALSKDPESKGIVFGSSGQGEAMVANKYKNVRAAVFYAPVVPAHNVDVTGRISQDPFEMIKLTREHNNANVLSMGAKILKEEDAIKAIKLWLETPFTNEERHQRRVEKLNQLGQKV